MSTFQDLTGTNFERWTVEGLWSSPDKKHWRCRCECGTVKRVLGDNLRAGVSKSCGCLRMEATTKHGMWKHPAYNSWHAARLRCRSPHNAGFKDYGGRGIQFCEIWDDFGLFWHDMGPTWFKGGTIDRIDNDGHYEPGNCQWSTAKEQAHNRRSNAILQTPKGPMNVTQAAEAFGISRYLIWSRMRAGWPLEMLFQKPAGYLNK